MSPGRADVSARLLIAMRDYAAMKLGADVAELAFERAVGDAGGDPKAATDPRAWVDLEVLHSVASTFEARLGSSYVTDAATWVIPERRDLSAMSLTALATPELFYRHIDRARSFFAHHLRFSIDDSAPGRFDISLHYREDVPRMRASCRVGRGVLLAVPLLFDLPPATVDESECYADGAPCCRYRVRFAVEPPLAWYGSGIASALAVAGALLAPSWAWLLAPTVGWVLGHELRLFRVRRLMTRVSEEHRRVLGENEREFQRRFDDIQALNESLERRVAERTAELEQAMQGLREHNAALRATLEDMKLLHTEVLEAGAESFLGRALRELEHEINNPMAYVLANLEHLQGEEPAGSDLAEHAQAVEDIRRGVDRIRSVVAWFISLHKDAPEQPSRYDVAAELRETARFLADRWGKEVQVHLAVDELFVPGQGRQLTQVFVNVMRNAMEAGCKNVWVTARRREERAIVRIRDDGPGIPREHLERVFDRGFTTKGKSGGSGIGLHVSRRIVERHEGRILARSEPSTGALLEIDLPLWHEPPEAEVSATARSPSTPQSPSSSSPAA